MTGSSKSSDGLDPRRRRLLFRAWHRGSREMDLVMGPFADAWIDRMSESELAEFERLVALPDPDLFDLVTGPEAAQAPANGLLARLRWLRARSPNIFLSCAATGHAWRRCRRRSGSSRPRSRSSRSRPGIACPMIASRRIP